LVTAWAAENAVLISARDLCAPGWVFHAPDDTDGRFVAGGQVHHTRELRCVVVRRPAVAVEELPWIADDDRDYAAAEINAFLVAWLSALPCGVFNRPTPTSLYGPAWSQTHWEIAAARAGVAWAHATDEQSACEVVFCSDEPARDGFSYRRHTCIAADCSGEADGEPNAVQQQVCARLASAAGVALLGVRFAGDVVAAVTLQPSLAAQTTRERLLAHIMGEVGA
jgi:hypothetical protein